MALLNSYSVPDPEKRKRIINKTVSALKEFTSVASHPPRSRIASKFFKMHFSRGNFTQKNDS